MTFYQCSEREAYFWKCSACNQAFEILLLMGLRLAEPQYWGNKASPPFCPYCGKKDNVQMGKEAEIDDEYYGTVRVVT